MSKKWKQLAARFAAENAGLSRYEIAAAERKAINSEPNVVKSEPRKIFEFKSSTMIPEFPLPISVEAARKLSVAELSGSNKHLMEYCDIPMKYSRSHPAEEIIHQWFFEGLNDAIRNRLYSKVGINGEAAMRIIRHTMTSRTSEYNHKMAGCAYMLDTWFEIQEE